MIYINKINCTAFQRPTIGAAVVLLCESKHKSPMMYKQRSLFLVQILQMLECNI